MSESPVLELRGIRLEREGTAILRGIDLVVTEGERWVVMGRNGCGKTSLLRIASLYLHPSSGSVNVLGATLGKVDVRRFRSRIGFTSAGFAPAVASRAHRDGDRHDGEERRARALVAHL